MVLTETTDTRRKRGREREQGGGGGGREREIVSDRKIERSRGEKREKLDVAYPQSVIAAISFLISSLCQACGTAR